MKIHPFKAWRPVPGKVRSISCVPYDVIDTAEARKLAEGNADSFLHVIRPEIDLPETTDIYDDVVYENGADNLKALLQSDMMVQDVEPHIYIYRLTMNGESQTGVFTCASVKEYDSGAIKKHEHTRPDKEDDRTRHILTQRAHAEPVMLIHHPYPAIKNLIDLVIQSDSVYDHTSNDGIRHEIWKTPDTTRWVQAFEILDSFYVADGHHRCKAASRAASVLKTSEGSAADEAGYFPAVIFASDQMRIMSYNRLIFKTDELKMKQLWENFEVVETGSPVPKSKGQVCIYFEGAWKTISLYNVENPVNSVQELDVYKLQQQVLGPIFDIADPRSDKNIAFVGGIRGTGELKRRVDSGEAALAVSMYPTSIDELLTVSDEGLLMPPKSTWFEPKLRSGFLIHTF